MARLGCSPETVDEYGDSVEDVAAREAFNSRLEASYMDSVAHDCLSYGGGPKRRSTTMWKVMEYLPFRRMDMQRDGSWKAVCW
jgi:hypothetical protein